MLSNLASYVKNWMGTRNETFSTLCGEYFTNGDVINVHVGLVAMLLMGALANAIGIFMGGY